jgi:membrane dipeptidase
LNSRKAKSLFRQSLTWDNHCFISHEVSECDLDALYRLKSVGVDVAQLNVGDSDISLETQFRLLALYRYWLKQNAEDFSLALTPEAIIAAKRENKLAVSFNIEGAFALGEQINLIELLYELGVRWMLIAYNIGNQMGGGCHDAIDSGVTALGRKMIAEMDRVGMIKDLSHTAYRTAREILDYTSVPVNFSHSNPRALVDHPRNLPDELIKACSETGGVVGISGVSIFLGDRKAGVETMARHIDYVVQLTSVEHVGIGLDFPLSPTSHEGPSLEQRSNFWPQGFGYDGAIEYIPPEKLPELTEQLLRFGYGDNDVRAVLGENFLRVARQVWK